MSSKSATTASAIKFIAIWRMSLATQMVRMEHASTRIPENAFAKPLTAAHIGFSNWYGWFTAYFKSTIPDCTSLISIKCKTVVQINLVKTIEMPTGFWSSHKKVGSSKLRKAYKMIVIWNKKVASTWTVIFSLLCS